MLLLTLAGKCLSDAWQMRIRCLPYVGDMNGRRCTFSVFCQRGMTEQEMSQSFVRV